MTIHEARKKLENELTTIYHKEEAQNIAGWVIENISGLSPATLALNKQTTLTDEQLKKLNTFSGRLMKHEPVQYVLNEVWFCGMRFYVDHHVLIPRPETEELVEWIISNLKFPFDKLNILDIGSGSGCIPISLKRKLRKAHIWSCDISTEALQVAKRNAATLGAAIKFLQLDFLNANDANDTNNANDANENANDANDANDGVKHLPLFDIIVSNPPYVPLGNKSKMDRNVTDYEPHTALFVPNEDPLIFYKAIAVFGKKHLSAGGNIFVEIHEEMGKDVKALFLKQGYSSVEIKTDMQGKERMIRVT